MAATRKPDVFAYMDYRLFLRDAFAARKQGPGGFSLRQFAQRAGLGSPSYLKAVIEGHRNLTQDTARHFASAFKLNKQETRFFGNLVAMNQATSTDDRAHYYEELSRVPRYKETKLLERSQYEYYARWYCVPIRELAARADFREDAAWIAQQLRPAITEKQAQEALSLLQALGMLIRDADGHLQQSEALVSTGPQLRSLTTRTFHRQMLHMASAALDTVEVDEREVGGVTIRLTAAQLQQLKKRMYEIRQEILQLDGVDGNDGNTEAVYHFAFQLFPLTLFADEAHDEAHNDD